MTNENIFQDILLNLKTLPEEKIKEVYDFVNFLKLKEKESIKDTFILSQFNALKEDWEARGMEVYDDL